MKIIKPFTKPLFFSVMLYAVIIHSCDRKDKTVGDITLDSMMLDSITENERTTGYQPGFGLVESTILEKNGDHAGAVIAAFKELCWARAFSTDNELSLELMQKGLAGVKELYTTDGVKTVVPFLLGERRQRIRDWFSVFRMYFQA